MLFGVTESQFASVVAVGEGEGETVGDNTAGRDVPPAPLLKSPPQLPYRMLPRPRPMPNTSAASKSAAVAMSAARDSQPPGGGTGRAGSGHTGACWRHAGAASCRVASSGTNAANRA